MDSASNFAFDVQELAAAGNLNQLTMSMLVAKYDGSVNDGCVTFPDGSTATSSNGALIVGRKQAEDA